MRQFAVLLLLLFLSVNSDAQVLGSVNGGGTDQSDYTIVLPYDPTVNVPIVNVEIAGKQYRFLFDTGAGTCISRKIVDEIKPEVMGKNRIVYSEGQFDSLYIYDMPEISLDGVSFKNIPSVLIQESAITQNFRLDGIIGSNLMRNSVVRFSSRDRLITITDNPAKFDLDTLKSTPLFLTFEQSSPIIKTFLKDKLIGDIDLLFDSGASDLYSIAVAHLLYFKELNILDPNNISEGMGSNSDTFMGTAPSALLYRLRLPELKVANYILKNVPITSTSNENSRMGASLFNFGIVTIDFINKRFYFDPFIEKETDLYRKEMPVTIVPRGNKFVIGVIWNKELEKEIQRDDQVLCINDISLEGMDENFAFRVYLDFSAKDSFLFEIKDKEGNIKEVQIEKE